MDTAAPIYKDLALIGGGHSHALVLKMWAMKPLPGVRLTLISPQVLTPYSGMLPGLVAGHYDFEDTHIDLVRLCRFAKVRFIQAAITGINLTTKEISFAERIPLGFDFLSINAGIVPDLNVPGAEQFITPVKPIAEFYPRWQAVRDYLRQDSAENNDLAEHGDAYRIAVVGGGAAGVELILAMHFALSEDDLIKRPLEFRLVQQGKGLPENYPRRVQREIARLLKKRQIEVSPGARIKRVEANVMWDELDQQIPFDTAFWCTQAQPAQWPRQAGLGVDERGFITVNQHLQSTSHNFVFAAGDIAQQEGFHRPRAGVFAVRHGPILVANLRRALLSQPLKSYRPQATFLSLLACGEQYGVGCRPGKHLLSISGKWVWRWKDRIDRRFMDGFKALPLLPEMGDAEVVPEALSSAYHNKDRPGLNMRCGGCGAKVGASILNRVIKSLAPIDHDSVVLGLHSPDDASAIRLPPGQLLVQSTDVFRALVDDPYVLGQIAAQHALSDIFAMNATPHSALSIVALPYAGESIVERDLLQLMNGAVKVLNENCCVLLGGHTSEAAEFSAGFTINGVCTADQLLEKTQPQQGHHLILTQALGTGTLFAAHAQLCAKGVWIEAATEAMLQSNREAAKIFYRYGASACTDISGFGLLGHLLEMLKPTGLGATIKLDQLPILEGAVECFNQGISSSLQPQNIRVRRSIADVDHWSNDPLCPVLFDPQTSGGLLASVPEDKVASCLQELRKAGYVEASDIGSIMFLSSVKNGQIFLQ